MRFVIDDGAFRGMDDLSIDLERSLSLLGHLLKYIRDSNTAVGLLGGWGNLEVSPGVDLATFLSDPAGKVDRDLRRLILGLLGKCIIWDDDPSIVVTDEDLRINGEPYESLGVAYAADSISREKGMGVLTLAHVGFVGLCTVGSSSGELQVAFAVAPVDCKYFYRTLYALENVSNDSFFEVAKAAFPDLRFSEELNFSKFDGGYSVRDVVVEHLSALNDKFSEFFVIEHGNSAQISARIGIDVSIEGETRSSEHLMAMRDVVFDGCTYRCEWHSKLEPHRNRIHFHPGDDLTGGRVLIGIFINHLPT